jgi:hypothetical protein
MYNCILYHLCTLSAPPETSALKKPQPEAPPRTARRPPAIAAPGTGARAIERRAPQEQRDRSPSLYAPRPVPGPAAVPPQPRPRRALEPQEVLERERVKRVLVRLNAQPYPSEGTASATTVNRKATSKALIWTRRACPRTWASSASSSIFSTRSVNWREPRAASATQVLSRH